MPRRSDGHSRRQSVRLVHRQTTARAHTSAASERVLGVSIGVALRICLALVGQPFGGTLRSAGPIGVLIALHQIDPLPSSPFIIQLGQITTGRALVDNDSGNGTQISRANRCFPPHIYMCNPSDFPARAGLGQPLVHQPNAGWIEFNPQGMQVQSARNPAGGPGSEKGSRTDPG